MKTSIQLEQREEYHLIKELYGLPMVICDTQIRYELSNTAGFRRCLLEEAVVFIISYISGTKDSLLITTGAAGRDLMHVPSNKNCRIATLTQ